MATRYDCESVTRHVEAAEEPWPRPSELEGVKSRKRAIFELEFGELHFCDRLHRVTGLKLTLQSRIAAVGEAGKAVTEMLLSQRKLSFGRPVRHKDLVVAHLGPHLIGTGGATTDQYRSAISVAMGSRPQVVFLDAHTQGQDTWRLVVGRLMESDVLSQFRGAVIIVAPEENTLLRSICCERWATSACWVWQEELAGDVLEVIEDALPVDKPVDLCPVLMQEVREISADCFAGDIITKVRARDWTMVLLTEPNEKGAKAVCGFMCYEFLEGKPEIMIHRLAVAQRCRGRGHGQRLMMWMLVMASRLPQAACNWISLTSLGTAVTFYERFGFTDMTCADPENLEQTLMQLRNWSVAADSQACELTPSA